MFRLLEAGLKFRNPSQVHGVLLSAIQSSEVNSSLMSEKTSFELNPFTSNINASNFSKAETEIIPKQDSFFIKKSKTLERKLSEQQRAWDSQK